MTAVTPESLRTPARRHLPSSRWPRAPAPDSRAGCRRRSRCTSSSIRGTTLAAVTGVRQGETCTTAVRRSWRTRTSSGPGRAGRVRNSGPRPQPLSRTPAVHRHVADRLAAAAAPASAAPERRPVLGVAGWTAGQVGTLADGSPLFPGKGHHDQDDQNQTADGPEAIGPRAPRRGEEAASAPDVAPPGPEADGRLEERLESRQGQGGERHGPGEVLDTVAHGGDLEGRGRHPGEDDRVRSPPPPGRSRDGDQRRDRPDAAEHGPERGRLEALSGVG